MKIFDKPKIELPSNMDERCVELCNMLNRLPSVETFDSCEGHGKHPYWIFFRCTDINVLSRLGRLVSKNYSDGNWEILADTTDTDPYGCFWLRTKYILPYNEMDKSIARLIEDITEWFRDIYDDYFVSGMKWHISQSLLVTRFVELRKQFHRIGDEVYDYAKRIVKTACKLDKNWLIAKGSGDFVIIRSIEQNAENGTVEITYEYENSLANYPTLVVPKDAYDEIDGFYVWFKKEVKKAEKNNKKYIEMFRGIADKDKGDYQKYLELKEKFEGIAENCTTEHQPPEN